MNKQIKCKICGWKIDDFNEYPGNDHLEKDAGAHAYIHEEEAQNLKLFEKYFVVVKE